MNPYVRAIFPIAALLLIGAGFRGPPEMSILLWLAGLGVLSIPRLMGEDDKSIKRGSKVQRIADQK